MFEGVGPVIVFEIIDLSTGVVGSKDLLFYCGSI
jgi:hypothetical protein